MRSCHAIGVSSVDVGAMKPAVVDSVVDADAGGGGGGSLLPGVCISPPNASVALEITTIAKRRHRSLFIVSVLLEWRQSGNQTAKSLSPKIITSLVVDGD